LERLSLNLVIFLLRLKDLKKEIQEVNWARKNQQTLVGERLRQLESQWVGLVSKNYEIETVIAKIEVELGRRINPEDEIDDEDVYYQDHDDDLG
jgi:pre-mRNA-splicing factor SPF27